MSASNPSSLAKEIAKVLKNDPVASAQIKEHFHVKTELLELLDISLSKESEISPQDALEIVRENFTLDQVLAAFNEKT